MKKKPIVALIYDFDGTLSPGNMQEFGFVQAIGKDPTQFWEKVVKMATENDASGILCYMYLMLQEAVANGIIGCFDSRRVRENSQRGLFLRTKSYLPAHSKMHQS